MRVNYQKIAGILLDLPVDEALMACVEDPSLVHGLCQHILNLQHTGWNPENGPPDEADLAAAQAENVQSRAIHAALWEWVQTYGRRLCPPGMDTYGEGIRDAHEQVSSILGDWLSAEKALRADDAGRVERVAAVLTTALDHTWVAMDLARAVLAAADGGTK